MEKIEWTREELVGKLAQALMSTDISLASTPGEIAEILVSELESSNIKKIINVVEFTNLGTFCPTQFEFTDDEGNEYYFRLRHGYASLRNTTTEEYVIDYTVMIECDGVCDEEEMVYWALACGVQIKGVID